MIVVATPGRLVTRCRVATTYRNDLKVTD